MASCDRDEPPTLEQVGDSVDDDKVACKQKLSTSKHLEESFDNISGPNPLSLSHPGNKEVRVIAGTLSKESMDHSGLENEESKNGDRGSKKEPDNNRMSISAADNRVHNLGDVCFICSQEDKQEQATFYCIECGDNLCDDCLKDHNRFPKMRSHRILKKGAKKVHVRLPTFNKCMYHDGRVLDTYCHSHEAVCCATCTSLHHSSCFTGSLQRAIASFQVDEDITPALDALKSLLGEYQHLKKLKQEHIQEVQATLQDNKFKIRRFKNTLISRIEVLNDEAEKDVTEKAMLCEEKINQDIQQINRRTTTVETMLQNLQAYERCPTYI